MRYLICYYNVECILLNDVTMKFKININFKSKVQLSKQHKTFKMDSRGICLATEKDFIEEGLKSERGFRELLKDEVYVDYFNTFLSLPIFAKRLNYRLQLNTFEMDIPSGQTCSYCCQEDVFLFALNQRGPLFMKTDICNEYRLCKALLQELYRSKADEKYELDLQREIGSVLSMQRLKAFLYESAGENILSFWLTAERYRRQSLPECLRFLIREIQDKYIKQGAWLELQESIKAEFNSCLNRLLDGSVDGSTSVNKNLLVSCQEIAFASLTSYWLPKYLAHRSHKRKKMMSKWRSVLPSNEPTEAKTQLADLLRNIKSKMEKSPEICEHSLSASSASQEPELQFPSEKSSMKDSLSVNCKLYGKCSGNIKGYESSERSETCSPDSVITLEDEESEAGDLFKSFSRASPITFKLPHLDATTNLVSANKQMSSNGIIRIRSSLGTIMGNGNQLAALCTKFRDVSLSRAIALTNNIRGSSLVDVEPYFAFPTLIDDHFSAMPQKVDENLEYLWTALAADQLAGQPFCDYIRLLNQDEAFANIRFWAAAQGFLSSLLYMDTLTRRRQSQALIHIYLLKDSPRKISISPDIKSKLCELLPNDHGYTTLIAACWQCAKVLMPFWMEFLDLDEERFAETVSYRITSSRKPGMKYTQRELEEFEEYKRLKRSKKREKIPAKHMWNALQLAISISVPRTAKPMLEGYEDVDEEEETGNKFVGSIDNRRLRVLNKQAAQALEDYRKSNPYQSAMAYYFYQQNLLLGNMGSKDDGNGRITTVTREIANKHNNDNKPKLPRPRSFQEVLHDPMQLDAFKKFLNKHDCEIPILFWQAVESMRINTKEAKQRQHRANGIVRRFFGPSTSYGKLLDCQADIVKDLPQMDKVTPAMLVSAQTCVARSIEEKWYAQYLLNFPGEEELSGISKLPHFRSVQTPGSTVGRGMKQRSRGLWKIFVRNVVSFRRGISNSRVLKNFQNYLKYEHKLNAKRSKEQGDEDTEKVLINNKLVSTEKLVNDLRFWIEVDRYKESADAVVICAKLGNYTKDDELIVTRKAKAIVNCFVDSLVPPRIQINIPIDIADSIMSHVKSEIIERGLFHDAAFSVFSVLLYYWKKFCYYRILPKTRLPECPSSARTTRSTKIERRKLSLQKNHFQRVNVQPGDEYTKIMFSLQNGIRIAVVPSEDENNSEDSNRLPRLNQFKLSSKLTRA